VPTPELGVDAVVRYETRATGPWWGGIITRVMIVVVAVVRTAPR